jgi:uncharacterized membrane protein
MTDRRLRLAMAVVGVAGLAIAGYLTWTHYAGIRPVCLASGGCERVQTSSYAHLAGVPVALIGIAGYAAILATVALRGETVLVLSALAALVGFGFSAYLTYLELFEIEAICQWCVASAVLMTFLAVATCWRLVRSPEQAVG